jgi:hypothetical protein
VATSGRHATSASRIFAALVVIVGLAMSACTGAAAPARSGTAGHSPRAVAGHSPRAVAAHVRGAASHAGGRVTAFCRIQATVGITAALSRTVGASLRGEVVPLGVSADGRTAYVSTWTPAFSGVAALNLPSGSLRPIQRFSRPATDQADGAWGGRWLVWVDTYSLQSLDDFAVFAWDSVTGRLIRLGHSLRSPAGVAWPSPWHAPAVSGSYAAWAQGYGPAGLVQIRLADLRTGQITVVRAGHVQAPFFDGGLLVWPESDSPGAPTTLRAYSLVAGRPAPLPLALRAIHGTDFVAADGTRTAYLSGDLTELYYSPVPGSTATMVLRLPAGVDFSNLAIGPGALAWTTTAATYLASTRTGGYAKVTPRYGFAVTGPGPAVLVSDAPSAKSAHPILALHVVNPSAVNWPRCRHQLLSDAALRA